jgi:uncharacterized membrane protein
MGRIIFSDRRRDQGTAALDAGDAARRHCRGAALGKRAVSRRRASPKREGGRYGGGARLRQLRPALRPDRLGPDTPAKRPRLDPNAATPLFSVLAAHVLTAEEKLSGLKVFGTVAGLTGVAWLIGPDLLTGAGANLWAELAVLAAALAYALSAIFGRRVRALGLRPADVAAGQLTAATLYLAPLALVIDRPWTLPAPSAATIAAVLAIAAFSTALAYVVYFRILAGAGATNVLLVTLLVPATSVVLGALFLHERLMGRQFLGFALIALGLAFIDGRLPRAIAQKLSNPAVASP